MVSLFAAGVWLTRAEPDQSITVTGDMVPHEDPAQGLTVEYPATWHRATETLTPYLIDPVQILAVGTGPLLGPGDDTPCAQNPTAALEAMGPADAFVSVQERISAESTGRPDLPVTAGRPPRPDRFSSSNPEIDWYRNDDLEVVACLALARGDIAPSDTVPDGYPPDLDFWAYDFRDKGRAFSILVVIGTEASDQTRAEAWAVLDSLQFEPR